MVFLLAKKVGLLLVEGKRPCTLLLNDEGHPVINRAHIEHKDGLL